MSLIVNNLKHIRKEKGLTQNQFAEKIGVSRSVIGAYEEGRAEPRISTLLAISEFFHVKVDDLVRKDLSQEDSTPPDMEGRRLRVLPVSVNTDGEELIPLVPIKASAGYTRGYGDAEYVGNLPQFSMPFPELNKSKTYRIFQTDGDSMLPVPHGAYVITEYLSDWNNVKSDECYVILTREDGMVFKRVINRLEDRDELLLKSDNPAYQPYSVKSDELLEIWKVLGYTSFELPDPNQGVLGLNELRQAIGEIKKEVNSIKGSN